MIMVIGPHKLFKSHRSYISISVSLLSAINACKKLFSDKCKSKRFSMNFYLEFVQPSIIPKLEHPHSHGIRKEWVSMWSMLTWYEWVSGNVRHETKSGKEKCTRLPQHVSFLPTLCINRMAQICKSIEPAGPWCRLRAVIRIVTCCLISTVGNNMPQNMSHFENQRFAHSAHFISDSPVIAAHFTWHNVSPGIVNIADGARFQESH